MRVTISGAVSKLCPYRQELDVGRVTLELDVSDGDGPELHAVAAYLGAFADRALSHEEFTRIVAADLAAGVVSTWTTAGLEVTCAVPRDVE